jgi:hypothetical protein
VAAAAGFATSAVGTGLLHLSPSLFVAVWAAVAATTITVWVLSDGWDPLVQLRRRWVAGLIAGVIAGVPLALAVTAGPASAARPGAGALLWLGLVRGTVDAVMLSVVPVLALYGARPGDDLGHASRIRMAGVALLASLIIAAAYHLGSADFRNTSVIQPLGATLILTAAYLLSGSPLAPIAGQVILNAAALLH